MRPLAGRRYATAVRAPFASMLAAADAVLPGELPLSQQLSRRSLWSVLPRTPAPRPDAVNRLAITVDLDYQADTDALPELVELLARWNAPMSVASVGALVAQDPEPYARAVAAGHEIVNHSQTHPDNPVLNPDEEFWHLSAERMAEEVGQAQAVIQDRLGVTPVGFRTPHFKDAHRLTAVLAGFPELTYVSSALASRSPLAGRPYLAPDTAIAGDDDSYLFAEPGAGGSALLQLPLTPCPTHRWSPFCSWHGIRADARPGSGAGMHDLPEWLRLWRQLLHGARGDGLAIVYFDPADLIRDPDTVATFTAMVGEAVEAGWRLSTLGEIETAYRPLVQSAAQQLPAGRNR